MSSDRSSPDLGAQLRASADEPEDLAAAELRARLRHKMFGVGVPVAPPPPGLPPDVEVDAPQTERIGLGAQVLVWAVPVLAVGGLAALMLWQRHSDSRSLLEPAARPQHIEISAPAETPATEDAPADVGPGALARAQALADAHARTEAVAAAVAAQWADPAAAQRLDSTVDVAAQLLQEGLPRQAIALLRAVLDDLELHRGHRGARARLLASLASCYDALRRPEAAEATRAEADRLRPR
ncbi:MAG: hypothetical protein ACE37F_06920 [Nannocystaceae bacterium]|nr:hypothetical protein [bacterium]